VLELACGPGTWTTQLLRHAAEVTAVDASPEMLGIASARVGKERVDFVLADLFGWQPDRRYDVVFSGFWLSHVPPERFASYWSLVADCLKPDGRVFFVNDWYRTAEELVEGEQSSVIQRRLTDGTAYRIVKVPHRPADLERQLERIGWHIKIHSTSGRSSGEREAARRLGGLHEPPMAARWWLRDAPADVGCLFTNCGAGDRVRICREERALSVCASPHGGRGLGATPDHVGDCTFNQAAARRVDARDSHASWISSASSLRVSSPIRLARSRTDGWPSKCAVVKNGDVSS
jgi:demethylmenaquinone methyltransferase/2-methoxy-6-polyprenyl-1,4-benzoquinol methylase